MTHILSTKKILILKSKLCKFISFEFQNLLIKKNEERKTNKT